jgi:hypothetical protein
MCVCVGVFHVHVTCELTHVIQAIGGTLLERMQRIVAMIGRLSPVAAKAFEQMLVEKRV